MQIPNTQSKQRILKNLSLLMMLAWSSFTGAQTATATATANCRALVQLQNNLWLVQRDGTPLIQLTAVAMSRFASAMSQDGNLIAYTNDPTSNNVSLLDANARFLANIDVRAQDSITGLKWINPRLLRIQEHMSPSSSLYHFVRIPIGTNDSGTINEVAQGKGDSCALSPELKDMACISGDAIHLRNRNIYYAPSPFISAVKLQTLDINVGRTVTTTTEPAFVLELKEIIGDTVALKVTTPDNLWQLQYVRPRDTMPVTFASDVAPTDHATVYGFTPRLRDRRNGIVAIDIAKSTSGQFSFEGGLAWDSRGHRIAAVETSEAGQRSLLMLDRRRSDDDDSGSEAGDQESHLDRDQNANAGKVSLPIDGPINSVEFISDTRVRVIGATQVFEQGFSAQGITPTGTYTISPALPQQLAVKIGGGSEVVPVRDWACR